MMMMNYQEEKGAEEAVQLQQLTFTTPAEPIPPEVMRLIFSKLPPRETLRLRDTCSAWRDNIESMYIPNRHLLIYFEAGLEAADLAGRFFATNLKRFKRIPIRAQAFPDAEHGEGVDYGSTVSAALLHRLTTMFPQLEHLLLDTVLDVESANALVACLPRWPGLFSLALFRAAHLPETRKVALRTALNHCDSLRRLGVTDLGRHWWRYLNFRSLQHFAYESPEAENIEAVVDQLTPTTYSFWTRCGGLSPQCVDRWAVINPVFIGRLEQLHLGDLIDMGDSARAYVNVSAFTNLSELRLQFESSAVGGVNHSYFYATLDPLTFASMAELYFLCSLELISFALDLAALAYANLLPLEGVTELTLSRFYSAVPFDGDAFCRTFSRLFPRLERLQLAVIHREDGEAVEGCISGAAPGQFFPHLQQFSFAVFVPPKSDLIFSYDEDYDHAFE